MKLYKICPFLGFQKYFAPKVLEIQIIEISLNLFYNKKVILNIAFFISAMKLTLALFLVIALVVLLFPEDGEASPARRFRNRQRVGRVRAFRPQARR